MYCCLNIFKSISRAIQEEQHPQSHNQVPTVDSVYINGNNVAHDKNSWHNNNNNNNHVQLAPQNNNDSVAHVAHQVK